MADTHHTTPTDADATATAAPEAREDGTAPLRGRIAQIPPRHVEALRDLFREPLLWPLNDGGWLRITRIAQRPAESFALESDGARLALRLDGGEALDADTGLHWSDYSGRSRTLAWTLAHESQLVRLSQALGVALLPIVDSAADAADDAEQAAEDAGLWLGFSILDATASITRSTGALRVPLEWVPRLTARAELPRMSPDPLWQSLTLPIAIAMNGPRLSPAEWRALRLGDVLLAGTRQRPPTAIARTTTRAWPISPTANGWRIDAPAYPLPPEETPIMIDPETSSVPEGEDNAPRPPEIPVRLEFDLGRLEWRYEDLVALQPGYVFPLPVNIEGANVTIRANGREAGRGEVVAIGDTLGVRLIAWS